MKISIIISNFLILVGYFLGILIISKHINNSKIKFKIIYYLILSLLCSAIFSFVFAWWNNASNIMLLKHYDAYFLNPDSNSYQVSYDKVILENIKEVEKLEKSIMGIGWPLKAIFMLVFFFPITLIPFLTKYSIKKA